MNTMEKAIFCKTNQKKTGVTFLKFLVLLLSLEEDISWWLKEKKMQLSAPFAFSPGKQNHEIMIFSLSRFSVSILLPGSQEPDSIVAEGTAPFWQLYFCMLVIMAERSPPPNTSDGSRVRYKMIGSHCPGTRNNPHFAGLPLSFTMRRAL